MERDFSTVLRILDYLVVSTAAAITALLAGYLIPSGWPTAAGMFAGMMLGVPVLLILVMGLSAIINAFESLMPGMPAVMITGMYGGMMAVGGNVNFTTLLTVGIGTGLLIQGILHVYDLSLHGEVAGNQSGGEK